MLMCPSNRTTTIIVSLLSPQCHSPPAPLSPAWQCLSPQHGSTPVPSLSLFILHHHCSSFTIMLHPLSSLSSFAIMLHPLSSLSSFVVTFHPLPSHFILCHHCHSLLSLFILHHDHLSSLLILCHHHSHPLFLSVFSLSPLTALRALQISDSQKITYLYLLPCRQTWNFH